MNFKKENSPINQRASWNFGSRMFGNNFPPQYQTSFMPTAVTGLNTVVNGLQSNLGINNAMNQTPINPKGFSNMDVMSKMYGQSNPGTFTRSLPFRQMDTTVDVDPLTGQPINPLASQSPTQPLIPDAGSAMSPTPPPVGVQQSITPFYDLSNK